MFQFSDSAVKHFRSSNFWLISGETNKRQSNVVSCSVFAQDKDLVFYESCRAAKWRLRFFHFFAPAFVSSIAEGFRADPMTISWAFPSILSTPLPACSRFKIENYRWWPVCVVLAVLLLNQFNDFISSSIFRFSCLRPTARMEHQREKFCVRSGNWKFVAAEWFLSCNFGGEGNFLFIINRTYFPLFD